MPTRDEYRLRPLSDSDLEQVLGWRNLDSVRSNMFEDHVISFEEHRSWFEKLKGLQTAMYMVFEFHEKPVGLVYFTDIDQRNNKCRWGFYLGVDGLPAGTGTVMGFLGLEYIFEKVGIRKICGEAFAFNKASIKFHKKLGFIQEGTFIKHILKKGIFEDVILFALFKESWLEKKYSLEKFVFARRES